MNNTNNTSNIFVGSKYRITVLTPRLVRIEYNTNSNFVDNLTELVMSRNFSAPLMDIKQDEKFVEIKTNYFTLSYAKEKPIDKSNNLLIKQNGTNDEWYYGYKEVQNYYGTTTSLDDANGKVKLKRGLYAANGIATIDDSDSLIWYNGLYTERKSKGIDIYVFVYNKDFGLALQDYFALTGYPPMIPRYALGNWWCKNLDYNDEYLGNIIDKFNRHNIPVSAILLDDGWRKEVSDGKKNKKLGYTFTGKLVNPKEAFDNIHKKGVRIGLNINPDSEISTIETNYNLLGVSDGTTIKYDYNNYGFISAYYNRFLKSLDDLGTDFYFLDYLPKESELNKLFLFNHYQFIKDSANANKRPMILSRNSNIASHRYPISYSGRTSVSFNTLKLLPYFNLSSANIGLSWWAHDIGGYDNGIEDSELFTRYVQLGTFSPIFMLHAGPSKYIKREPWRWDIKTYKIVEEYCNLRHKLIPYLYSEAYKYHKKGLPIIQPLYYRYPWVFDDVLYRNQYYFGSELLISPICDRKEAIMSRAIHRFFIPEGIWYDFRTGKKLPGGRKYVSFFKDEDYPVFAKAGAIVPMSQNTSNDTSSPKELEIHIFPGRSNNYNLYEDDGVTSLYKEGFYLLTNIDYNYQANNYTVIIRSIEGKSGIIPDYRDYKIRFRNVKKSDDVIVYFKEEKFPSVSYVDENDFIVEVKNVPTVGQLTINCKGKDIEIDALRVINDDIDSIIMDLPIETEYKEKISSIMFNSELDIKKKRIEIRKLKRTGLDMIYIKLFLRLLEYINEI